MRLIDADALMTDCQLAQKQADRHGREFANAFYSGGGDISTEWWCVEDMIENAPTIEPERKTGKWIKLDKDNKFFVPHMLKCSECGNTLDKHGVNAGRGDANYCPNCGARMEEWPT